MEMMDHRVTATSESKTSRILLCVTDLAIDSDNLLDAVCQLATTHGAQLEMIHVVDIENEKSHPDGQMGIHFRLEVLGRALRRLRQEAASLLLFGRPEDVIARRAKEMKAVLVAFAVTSPAAAVAKAGLIRRVAGRVSCPVIVVPPQAA